MEKNYDPSNVGFIGSYLIWENVKILYEMWGKNKKKEMIRGPVRLDRNDMITEMIVCSFSFSKNYFSYNQVLVLVFVKIN